MSQRNRCNALTFYNFTVYPGGVQSQRGQKWNYTSSASPPSAFGLFLPFPTDFNLFGAADWQPVLSLRVTVVEISLRGSMQISSDRARASGGGKKKFSLLEMHKTHKQKDTCAFNGIVRKSCLILQQPKNLVKQIRPRPAEQFNYSVWL